MAEDYIIPPGSRLEPGDVFSEVPFPLLKYPLQHFRPSAKSHKAGHREVFGVQSGPPKPGDIPRSTVQLRQTMLLSHGCEIDRDIEYNSVEKRHWLGAPVEPFKGPNGPSPEMQSRIREGRQPNKFYIPACDLTKGEELFVDFRRITPINCKYFVDASGVRLFTLSDAARDDLHAILGVFFSGRAFYLGQISCPNCQYEIDTRDFTIDSPKEPDAEYE